MNDKASNPTDITAFGLVSVPAVLVYEHIMRRPEERRRRMAFKAFALTFFLMIAVLFAGRAYSEWVT